MEEIKITAKNRSISLCLECNKNVSYISSHIKSHGITPKEYYYKHFNIIDPLCYENSCNEVAKFSGPNKGYSKFCSSSCSAKVSNSLISTKESSSIRMSKTLTRLHKEEGFKKFHSERMSELMTKQNKDAKFCLNRDKSSSERLKKLRESNEFVARISRNSFLSIARNKNMYEGIFYILTLSDSIKIGICFYDSNFNHFNGRCHSLKIHNKDIFIGKIEDVAELEYKIKSKYIPVNKTEFFSIESYTEIKLLVPENILLHST